MTQYFLETDLQPHLIVLTHQLCCNSNEPELYFYDFLLNFEANFTEQQNSDWEKYWGQQGELLILEQWKIKYGDYLADSAVTENENLSQGNIDKQESRTGEKQTIDEASNIQKTQTEENPSWQELWQQHSEKIYFEQFYLFTSIYYNFYLELKNKLQNTEIETSEEDDLEVHVDSVKSVNDLEDNVESEDLNRKQQHKYSPETKDFTDLDLKQLELLGLPTEFGARQQVANSKKRRSKNNSCECLDYNSAFISDSEAEEYINEFASIAMSALNNDDEKGLHALEARTIVKAKKKKNRKLRNIPAAILEDKILLKYWHKRFSLFSRFDKGIRLDRESWFSVTPEKVAIHLAERLICDTLIDGFCGCGGNAIQFAKTCKRVIAIDIDPLKIEMAKHNAKIYGVAERIEFIVADFFHLAERLHGDVVFLSPPWGGPKYKNKQDYDVEKFLLPVGASVLVDYARRISKNVALFLPRNSNLQQIVKIAGIGKRCEVEHNYLDTRLVAITALYGDVILRKAEQVDT